MNHRLHPFLAAVILAALFIPTAAYAQADFSGVWQPRYDEDNPERMSFLHVDACPFGQFDEACGPSSIRTMGTPLPLSSRVSQVHVKNLM